MPKFDVTIAFFAVVGIAVVFLSAELAPDQAPGLDLWDDSTGRIFLGIWTIAALPVAFAMPRLKVGFFNGSSHYPSQTYVMPHWMVRLMIGGLIGQGVAALALGVFQDHRFLSIAGMTLLMGVALYAGAWSRLKRGPHAEFTMRWWPWNWR